jgi:hypothetical protein
VGFPAILVIHGGCIMPLLDHFHPPLSSNRHWQGFHSAWANALTRQLNRGLLPPRYFAEPNVQIGTTVEIDVAAFEEAGSAQATSAGVATAVWAPPRPPLTAPLDVAVLDVVEVQIFQDEEGPRLVAAIELVSPANKDRPSHREAFAIKCVGYLHQRIGVVVADIVTSRSSNLHAELLERLHVGQTTNGPALGDLYAAAYRTLATDGPLQFEAWPHSLALGADLPTVPLWLGPDLALPLDLEQSYLAACETLRLDS